MSLGEGCSMCSIEEEQSRAVRDSQGYEAGGCSGEQIDSKSFCFQDSVHVLNWVQDSECQESSSGPMLFHPPCGRCTWQGTTCILPPGAKSQTCQGCQKLKVKCHPGKGATMMVAVPVMTEWSVSGEKWKGKSLVVLPRKGEKWKCTKRVMANAASIEEIKAALGGLMTAGLSQQQLLDLVAEG